ncbi:tetratricopeptide repeat protein [Lutibacter sp. TH_r2]|uniref:tetratricopeptide repeat protein n=1 Tax=Lutibacter sp. TH_r2 TaxID=3082083 RepID=UPI0029556FC7|nr:tetratricopeptide repeat protein [Lutibacter sp. TH_r2]MDV7186327.1 tetratricopeptide repeat protein [Lutibacter sp. TH_r2]
MRVFLIILIALCSLQTFAQEQQLAYQYFRNGEYEKASAIYKTLYEKHPYNSNYVNYLIDCYQQLEKYSNVETIIENQLNNYQKKEYLYAELGYNFQLQQDTIQAKNYYQKALSYINKPKNAALGYLIGKSFQDNHLLDYAIKAYKKAMEVNPTVNYYFQLAFIYGEKGEIEKMFDTYLNMISLNDSYLPSSKTYIGKFITDDSENKYNISLKKLLFKRMQNNPDTNCNEMLSWLYMQQKDYNKALIQEKAIYKRTLETLTTIIEVGGVAFENNDYETAKNAFEYVIENATDNSDKLAGKLYLLQIDMDQEASIETIQNQFLELFKQYGNGFETFGIQLAYADFLAFKKNEINNAINTLKNCLKLPLSDFEKGKAKTKIADILVFDNKFNSALIYYTQVQNNLKNHVIGQLARFKIAKTSYYKGDFEWAQSQLKILKNSTSQLIANDALDLNLLITDNQVMDSLKIALKTYAKADLLSFQHKNTAAIDTLTALLSIKSLKEHPIIDEALFKQAELFQLEKEFDKAETNYLKIIALNPEDILVDDAIYKLAELYKNQYNNLEKAKEYYQKIIFEYPSSIYLVEARKKFRKLRGDFVN